MKTEETASYIIDDEDLFPIFVSLGYDVYGYSNPLYFTDGITIYPDGRLETDDDLEDALAEYRTKKDQKSPDYDFIDDMEDLNFQETRAYGVGRELVNFSEVSEDNYVNVVNDINFALIAALDSRPPEHIHEATLFNAAIDAGMFSAKRAKDNNYSFSEEVQADLPEDQEVLEVLFSEYGLSTDVTLRALGYADSKDTLSKSLRSAKSYIDNNPDATPAEMVRVIKLATGLQKQDLAKASVRLSIGTVDYKDLPRAALLSHLSFAEQIN